MRYNVEIRPSAGRDFKKMPQDVAARVIAKIQALRDDLRGDVKKLAGDKGYRLRVGDYRVLFDLDRARIIVRRVRHRREAYDF